MQNNIYNRKEWIDKFIYRESTGALDRKRIEYILEAIPKDAKKVLDVGTGGGYIYKELIKRGLSCFGIDISLDLVRGSFSRNICVGDVGHIPFKNSGFDIILTADLLEHVKEESFKNSISELVRVSRKYILINSPYRESIDWPVSLCNMCKREFNIYGHVKRVDMKLIRELFPKDKFSIEKIKTFGKKRDLRPSWLVKIARKWGKVYNREGALCPYCFNASIKHPPRNFFQEVISRMICAIFVFINIVTPRIFKPASEIRLLTKKI